MNQNFKAGSCSTSKKFHNLSCPVATAKMLKACLGKSIPDVPLGNPTAGSVFDRQRGQMIEAKMKHAGCPVEDTLMAMIPTPAPVPNLQYTVRKNHRGNCPPKDYSGSMCHVMSSDEAQEQCSHNKYCRFYVWSGRFGHQKADGALTLPNCMWMCAVVPAVFRSWKEGDGTGFSGWESGYVADRSTPSPTPPLVLRQLVMHIRLSGYTHAFTKAGFDQTQKRSLILAVADAADVPATSIKVVEVQDSKASSGSGSSRATGGRRLDASGVAIHRKRPKPGSMNTIIVTVTLTTYDAELERQTENDVNDGGFAKMLEIDLKRHGIFPSAIGVEERISEGPPDHGDGAGDGAATQPGSTESFGGANSLGGSEDQNLGLLLVLALGGLGVLVAVRGGHLHLVVDRLATERRDADDGNAEESQVLTLGNEGRGSTKEMQ